MILYKEQAGDKDGRFLQCPYRVTWSNNQCELREGHAGKHQYTFKDQVRKFGKSRAWLDTALHNSKEAKE